MPTAREIRDYVSQEAIKYGVNPGLAIGIVEQTSSYNPNFSSGTRRGLMGIPKNVMPDNVKQTDWKKQVDLGINLLALAKRDAGGLDIGGAVLYMGSSPEAPDQLSVQKAVRAYARGAKYTNEDIDEPLLDSIYQSFGMKSNAAADIKAAGLKTARMAQKNPTQLSREEIRQIAADYAPGLEKEIDALAGLESSYGANPLAYKPNKDGVIGPLQIMSKSVGGKYGNFEKYAVDGMNDPLNPVHSTIAGARMFADKVRKNNGNIEKAVNEYFTGVANPPNNRKDSNINVAEYRDRFFSALKNPLPEPTKQLPPQQEINPQQAISQQQLVSNADDDFTEEDDFSSTTNDEEVQNKLTRDKTLDERIAAALDLKDIEEPEDIPHQLLRYIEAQFDA